MNFRNLPAIIFFLLTFSSTAQHLALTFQEADKRGISVEHLDSLYKSALHSDSSLAVFKSEADQQKMYESYVKMLKDFGNFLAENNFKWDRPTKCFNRIYFNSDGTIDYLLYNFLEKNVTPEEMLSKEKLAEFDRLVNLFIKDYKFSLTAAVKFAQCSPVTYGAKE